MQKIQLEGLIVAAIVMTVAIIAALNLGTTSTFAQNTTGNKTAAGGGNATAGNTTAGNSSSSSSSSATPKATASPPPSTAGPKYPALEPMVAYHESNHNKLQQGLLIFVLHSGDSFSP